jgi:putative ABC transport system permease protein
MNKADAANEVSSQRRREQRASRVRLALAREIGFNCACYAMMSSIDWKLGWRMLVKYPGLTVVGGLTLALTIGLGAGWFEITQQILNPRLPFDQGERIVRLETWDADKSRFERRSLHDFQVWRTQLTTVRELGAARSFERNLIASDGSAATAAAAEISPSAFALTRVPPALGRTLIDADAAPGAPDVVVIGASHDRRRHAGRIRLSGKSRGVDSTARQ